MHALAMSVKVDSAFAIPSQIKDKALAAQLISGVLGVPADVIESRLDSSQNFVWIERKLAREKAEAIKELNLTGVYTQPENKRFYPKGRSGVARGGICGHGREGPGRHRVRAGQPDAR